MTFSPDLADVVQDVLHHVATLHGSPELGAWPAISQLGWATVGIDEAAGGSGGTIVDLAEIAAGLGRNAVSLPVLETATTQWAHAQLTGHVRVGTAGPSNYTILERDRLSIVRSEREVELTAKTGSISWPNDLEYLLVLGREYDGWVAAVIDHPGTDATVRCKPSRNADFDVPTFELEFERTRASASQFLRDGSRLAAVAAQLQRRRSLLRAAAMVGAAEQVCALTIAHVSMREQFGRPLSRLQAVAHSVGRMMSERDLMTAAVQRGLEGGDAARCAAALATAGRSVGIIAACAHQLHGAMGITREYPLHQFTRRLWAWRDEETTQRGWEHQVGLHVVETGEPGVWSLLVDEGQAQI